MVIRRFENAVIEQGLLKKHISCQNIEIEKPTVSRTVGFTYKSNIVLQYRF